MVMRYLTIGLPEGIYEKVVHRSGKDEVSKAIVIREALRGYFGVPRPNAAPVAQPQGKEAINEWTRSGENPLAGPVAGND